MGLFACLMVARFPVAALVRAEPELRGCPLVVCEGVGRTSGGGRREPAHPRALVVEVSPEAARRGARPGMTVAQTLARCSDLLVRPLDREALRAGRAALLEVASTVSPRVELGSRGEVTLDLSGVDRLFGSPAGVAAALARRAERVGFEPGVGIAAGPTTARIAAARAAGEAAAIAIPPGGDAAWLAPLPLRSLAPVLEERGRSGLWRWSEVAALLERIGVRRLGDLARLPPDEVATRFGTLGARAWRIAAGRDERPLVPRAPRRDLVEGVALESGIDSLEALLFVLRGLLGRLRARLEMASLAFGGLGLELDLDGGGRAAREVGVLAPTRDVATLAMLARAPLGAAPPEAPVRGVRAVARPARVRAEQLDLFRPPGPAPERLAATIARLGALCGPGRVGRPVPPEGHRPDELRLAAFDGKGEGPRGALPLGRARRRRSSAAPPPSPRGRGGAESGEEPEPLPALRAIRPPLPVEVCCEGGRVVSVRAPTLGGRALASSGPWRIETGWWTGEPCRRDYYDVELGDGGLYRIYRDLGSARRPGGSWFVDGRYD